MTTAKTIQTLLWVAALMFGLIASQSMSFAKDGDSGGNSGSNGGSDSNSGSGSSGDDDNDSSGKGGSRGRSLSGNSGSHGDQEKVRRAVRNGRVHKLADVVRTATVRYPGDIVSVKLKEFGRNIVYELKILQERNRLVRVRVNAEDLSIY